MANDDQGILWEVFLRVKAGRPFKHVGSLHAYDKEMAMKAARDLYTRRNEGNGIWIVKAEDIVSSEASDGEAFFETIIFTKSPFRNILCSGDVFPLISQETVLSPTFV